MRNSILVPTTRAFSGRAQFSILTTSLHNHIFVTKVKSLSNVFDGNCYIAITRKLDTHDVSRYRVPADSADPIAEALSQIQQPTLVLGIESDGLFTFDEQKKIAASVPNARLKKIESPEGHDAFLLHSSTPDYIHSTYLIAIEVQDMNLWMAKK
ncbi:hypothetical protein DID88_002635 [Monilinia fructigena]|uniref:Uncharacterized protein n=1 Tax=Monilinia fructigena TaxID=38457 RepID=A0A395IPS9_9HELO|nr:hypothetical protein DID88_002635 [Monilinia fructigena]